MEIFIGVPEPLREAIPFGIGLFFSFIGHRNINFIMTNPGTTIALVDLTNFEL
jgi:xanthine/uracil/vitamin C permease (AzgA family)